MKGALGHLGRGFGSHPLRRVFGLAEAAEQGEAVAASHHSRNCNTADSAPRLEQLDGIVAVTQDPKPCTKKSQPTKDSLLKRNKPKGLRKSKGSDWFPTPTPAERLKKPKSHLVG